MFFLYHVFKFNLDLRKLIKYEDRIGINTQQDDYYESLFRRTTASYRAKIDRENDKRGTAKPKYFDAEPSCSRPAKGTNRKVLSERNYRETSTSSNELLSSIRSSQSSIRSSQSQIEKKGAEVKIDRRPLKVLIDKTLSRVLHDKQSQEVIDKNEPYISKGKSPITSIVEQVLKENLSELYHNSGGNNVSGSSDHRSLRSIVEDMVIEMLKEKFSSVQKENTKSEDTSEVKILNQELQEKLKISKNQGNILPREPVTHYNNNPPLDSQALVQQLLSVEDANNKRSQKENLKKSKTFKENSNTRPTAGYIKRLQRSPRKKPEWQDPSLQDKVLDKPVKPIRTQSPIVSSSARSGRSKCSSSVLIRRSKSQTRKPNSDPVALYQYYKNEWEHFRNQIPGESPHGRLRWHVRHRLLDRE